MPKKETTKKTTTKRVETKTKRLTANKKSGENTPAKTPKQSEKKQVVIFRYVDTTGIQKRVELFIFIQWIALPPLERNPKTHQEFSAQFGVSIDTLTDWKKLSGFWDEVHYYTKQYYREWTPKVLNGLARRAELGKAKEVELFMKIFEKFTEKLEIVDPMTPERAKATEERIELWKKRRIANARKKLDEEENELKDL